MSQWKEVNSFLYHDDNDEGKNHEEREHTNDFESHNHLGGDKKYGIKGTQIYLGIELVTSLWIEMQQKQQKVKV